MHIEIAKEVFKYICHQADIGYESPYKQERIGFLFGTINKNCIKITKAIAYKGGVQKRTRIDFYEDYFNKRAKSIASKLRKTWLGTYHTHVEEDGDIFLGLSEDDKDAFQDYTALIGLTVSIWATDESKVPRCGIKRLTDVKRFRYTNYRYIVSGYVINNRGPRLVRLLRV